jgi:hypothetical protein
MQLPGPAFRAGGTIAPFRAVMLDTTADHQVLQATANASCVGIAQDAMKGTPGISGSDTAIAAVANDPITVWSVGQVAQGEAGGTVTRGDWVEADANGKLITSAGAGQHNVVGKALESATVGVKFDVLVTLGQITI